MGKKFEKKVQKILALRNGGKKFRLGLFPLSGDPITNGHIDVIEKALELCEKLIVMLGVNDDKVGKQLFTTDERLAFVERVVHNKGWQNRVQVITSKRLMVDEYMVHNCDVLFRGIRGMVDKDYENLQLSLSNFLLHGLSDRVIYLKARKKFRGLSSSMIKVLVSRGVSIDGLVPLCIKAELERRISKQYFVGVTGGIACGKGHVCKELVNRLIADGQPAMHVDFDQLQRELYDEYSAGAQAIRDQLDAWFGNEVLSEDRLHVNRGILADKLFNPSCETQRTELLDLVMPHILRLMRETIGRFEGIILLEWAQLVEQNLFGLVNNQVIVVDSPDREQNIKERNISPDRLTAIQAQQLSADEKAAAVRRAFSEEGYGWVIEFKNHRDCPDHIRVLAYNTREDLGLID